MMSYSSPSRAATALIIGGIVVLLYIVSTLELSRDTTSSVSVQSTASAFSAYRHRVMYTFPGLELYVYRAYIDDRFNKTLIRIFGLEKKNTVSGHFRCSWTTLRDGVTVQAHAPARKYMVDTSWPDWSPYFANNFDCPIRADDSPSHVCLSRQEDGASITVPVELTPVRTPRRRLSVCVKPVTGGHFRVDRFVEWLEMQRQAGVERVIIYNTDLAGAARFVLGYYERNGLVQVVDYPYLTAILQKVNAPGYSPEKFYAIYQQVYLVAMHDCLYRFRKVYEHMAFIDIDEVILPTRDESLVTAIQRARTLYPYAAGLLFLTAWHFEDYYNTHSSSSGGKTASYLYMQKYKKATNPIDNQPKCVFVTDYVVKLNFHSVVDVFSKAYGNYKVSPVDIGYLHHFRGLCDAKFEKNMCKELNSTVHTDPVIPRYEAALRASVGKVLEQLQVS